MKGNGQADDLAAAPVHNQKSILVHDTPDLFTPKDVQL